MPQTLPQFFAQMGRKGGQQQHKPFGQHPRQARGLLRVVHKHHQGAQRGVEAHAFDVFRDFLHRFMKEAGKRVGGPGFHVGNSRAQLTGVGHDQRPGPVQEAIHASNRARIPGFDLLQRPHKHLIAAQRVGPILRNHGIGIHHIAPGFRHFVGLGLQFQVGIIRVIGRVITPHHLVYRHIAHTEPCRRVRPERVLGLLATLSIDLLNSVHRIALPLRVPVIAIAEPQNHALIDQTLERFRCGDEAAVVQDVVPEAGIQ